MLLNKVKILNKFTNQTCLLSIRKYQPLYFESQKKEPFLKIIDNQSSHIWYYYN